MLLPLEINLEKEISRFGLPHTELEMKKKKQNSEIFDK